MIDLQHDDPDRWISTLAMIVVLVGLWACTHHYRGLGGDAELYAMQALSRIYSNLRNDIFLRGVSQDTYTIFPAIYAWWIRLLGLREAALALTVAFKVWLLSAAWAMVRTLADRRTSFFAVTSLILVSGAYGAYGVFHFAEDWLTARSFGEALVITACALHFRGFRVPALMVAGFALFVHPLMALPGLLLLLCLEATPLIGSIVLATGVAGMLVMALYSLQNPHSLTILDGEWLQVVRERSQFLFLQLWSVDDWQLNARPFLSLTLSVMAMPQPRVRILGISCMLIGATGLIVAMIGGSVGPVAILVQAQSWRWVWVDAFMGILLLAPTAVCLYQDGRCGLSCSILLCCGWIVTPGIGVWCLACALVIWLAREQVNLPVASLLRYAGVSAGLLCFGKKALRSRTLWSISVGLFLIVAVFKLPASLRDTGVDGTAKEIDEFEDWRSAIPPGSNVFVESVKNAPTFAWFTLQRPSYLTVDQSSGVVFSRATALEVRRRAQVLLPLMDPDWKLLSMMSIKNTGSSVVSASNSRPVTRDRLYRLCGDPQLNFVVARDNVGFGPNRHLQPGPWRDWNLYDCRRVRSLQTAP